jgi:CMP/dCMP kinase
MGWLVLTGSGLGPGPGPTKERPWPPPGRFLLQHFACFGAISYITSPLQKSPLSQKSLVIAIDGPAASGKSTTAKLVAERLGFLHLDTGAMYRAVTLKVLREHLDPRDSEKIARLVQSTRVELRRESGHLRVLLDGEDVTDEIRSVEVTQTVSAISSLRAVRQAMVREQRTMGEQGSVVAEGRDIGTVVFPGADLKFFVIADIEARARRRQKDLREQGVEKELAEIERAIRERDALDSSREESPLRKAADAIELDTSDMTIEDQVQFVVAHIRRLQRRHEAT